MYLRLLAAPQNSVVVASEIWPSLSAHSRALQFEKSRTRPLALWAIGCSGASVRGILRLNAAAAAYKRIIDAIAASGAVSMPVSNSGRSIASRCRDTTLPISWPPSAMPRMIDMIVSPSIQPLALTSCEFGKSSVRMPYLAGEYAAAPSPTIAYDSSGCRPNSIIRQPMTLTRFE